jgi:hypothetical protein
MIYKVTCVTREKGIQSLGTHEANSVDEAKRAALAYSSLNERILLITACEINSKTRG